MTCSPPSTPTTRDSPRLPAISSPTARTGQEDLAVQVDVELDRREPGSSCVDRPAVGRVRVPVLTCLAGIADVVIGAVLRFADPLPGRLGGCLVEREHVPAAALVIDVALLDHRAIGVPGPPPGQGRAVLP